MLFRVTQRRYKAKQTRELTWRWWGSGSRSCAWVRRALHIWGTPAAMAGREAGTPRLQLWEEQVAEGGGPSGTVSSFQRVGFCEWLKSQNFLLVVERISEIIEFKCASFGGRNGSHREMQLAWGFKAAGGQVLWFSLVHFAKATDWTTTGLVVLVRNSLVLYYHGDETEHVTSKAIWTLAFTVFDSFPSGVDVQIHSVVHSFMQYTFMK